LPSRTGLTRPILADGTSTKNPCEDELTPPKLLNGTGCCTALIGKWHLGEAKGILPYDVGFDECYGFYPAQKKITQRVDPSRYPDLDTFSASKYAYKDAVAEVDLYMGTIMHALEQAGVLKNEAGQPGVYATRRRERAHKIEEVGRQLRGMMSWIDSKEV